MKYGYTVVSEVLDTRGRFTKRPIVELEIRKGSQARKFLGLIDSGADHVTMPAAIAEVFGIERAACPPRALMGISMEPIEGFVGELSIRIQHQTEAVAVPVVFIDTDLPILLGQEVLFERYRIKFEKDHDRFEIVPVSNRH